MKLQSLLLASVLLLPSTLYGSEDCSAGLGKYIAGDYQKAFKLLKKEADKGLDCAQHWVARMYQLGHGTPMNKRQSLVYYELAALQGYEQSILQLELLKQR